MTIHPEFPLQAETSLPGFAFGAMRMVMLHEAQEHDMPVIENTDSCITLKTPYGLYSFSADGDGIKASVYAAKSDWLYMLKDGLVDQLSHLVPEAATALRWSDNDQESDDQIGELPPNIHFATVRLVMPIGPSFLRVRVEMQDLSSFQNNAIHFRLLLPPKELTDVEWPHVGENGSTVWPKGDKALHRPVYTTRWVDQAEGLMDFDVFLHDRGRVTEWVSTIEPGARVALAGPGGGGVPDTKNILLYADETAFPAAARILETLPADTKGHATFMAANKADFAYPASVPAAVSLTWLSAESSDSLSDLALASMDEYPDHFLWFACEKSDTQRVRAEYKAKSRNPENAYIAAYWSKS
ncbi:MAG: siderophore-interacting protein [Rhodobacteraceae bacterium]|nr:siderophore-interacting protein [Paracoccaceae bacterium]